MPLVDAIDALLAFVPEEGHYPWNGEWQSRFEELDQAVLVESCRVGLDTKLPPKTEDDHITSLGSTNLPVWCMALGFSLVSDLSLRNWRNRLVALRELASPPPPKPGRTVSGSAVEMLLDPEILEVVQSGQSSDDKMRRICDIDRRFLGFDSEQWANLLGVKGGAIRKNPFWTTGRKRAIEENRELRD